MGIARVIYPGLERASHTPANAENKTVVRIGRTKLSIKIEEEVPLCILTDGERISSKQIIGPFGLPP